MTVSLNQLQGYKKNSLTCYANLMIKKTTNLSFAFLGACLTMQLIAFSAFFAILLLSTELLAGDADITKIKKALEGVQWISVNERRKVVFKPENWLGPEDISFNYKVRLVDGYFYVWGDLKDDKTVLRNSDTIISDHIEVWLADPTLEEQNAKNLKELEGHLKEYEERLKSSEEDDVTKKIIREFVEKIKKAIKEYNNNWYYSQLIFNNSNLSIFPKNTRLIKRVFFKYKPKVKGGYEFFALIPLNGACDFKNYEIGKMGYLIDAIDIDSENANKQESLLSSSEIRQYKNPSTFNVLAAEKTYILSATMLEKLKSKWDSEIATFVNVNGFFKYLNGKYTYYVQYQLLYIGKYGADRNAFGAFYKPMELENISKIKNLEIYDYDKSLLITKGKKSSIVNLENYINGYGLCKSHSLFQKIKSNKTYVVIEVECPSRWPPGSTYCGAGIEVNLVWIELDQNLHSTKVQSVLIESCFKDVYEWESLLLRGNKLKVNGIPYDSDTEATLIYDNEKPEVGFVETKLLTD